MAQSEAIVHSDLADAIERVYRPSGLVCSSPEPEAESADYGACSLTMAGLAIRFRAARITPTKTGQFVTLWKRLGNGPIQPFDSTDAVDFFIVGCRRGERMGQFIFSRGALRARNIVATGGIGGKRAIRVYPPWDEVESRQAAQTQRWQAGHFLAMPADRPADARRLRLLLGLGEQG